MTDQPVYERVRQVVEPSLVAEGLELVDIERQGAVLRVTVDLLVGHDDQVDLPVGHDDQQVGRPGIDLEAVTIATRIISELLDSHDLIGDRTTLEVSSPGIERALRTPEHFRRFVGATVTVKTRPGTGGERRVDGVLDAADEDGVIVAGRPLPYGDIERARTTFIWPASTKPTSGGKRAPATKTKAATSTRAQTTRAQTTTAGTTKADTTTAETTKVETIGHPS